MRVELLLVQRSVSIAKHDNQDIRENLSTAQQKMVAAEKEADEIRTKAHADARAASSKIKALEVSALRSRPCRAPVRSTNRLLLCLRCL